MVENKSIDARVDTVDLQLQKKFGYEWYKGGGSHGAGDRRVGKMDGMELAIQTINEIFETNYETRSPWLRDMSYEATKPMQKQ